MNAANTCACRQSNAGYRRIARHTLRSTIVGVCPATSSVLHATFRPRSAMIGLTLLSLGIFVGLLQLRLPLLGDWFVG